MKRWLLTVLAIVSSCILNAWEIDWDGARKLRDGFELLHLETVRPRLMKIFLMRIDLRTEGLQFTGTGRDPDWGEPMPDYPEMNIATRRVRTRDFLLEAREPPEEGGAGLNMVAAVNSAPWAPWVKPFDHRYAVPFGLAILDGEVICDARPQLAVFAVYEDGRADIVPEVPERDYPDIRLASSGFGIILADGELLGPDTYDSSLHPRTAYGLSADRQELYLLVIDGRQEEWSLGATTLDCAEILRAAGAADAINMDGGGSATLCYWDDDAGEAVTVNRHNADGYQRPVAANVGIFLSKNENAAADSPPP